MSRIFTNHNTVREMTMDDTNEGCVLGFDNNKKRSYRLALKVSLTNPNQWKLPSVGYVMVFSDDIGMMVW